MKALIALEQNNRIIQVATNRFDVAPPWYWVDCPNGVTPNWTYSGQVFTPPPAPLQPSLAEQFEQVRFALQASIDDKAKTFGFSGGNALILYAGFTNPFQTLATQFANWEVSVWVEAGQYKDQVIAGTSPMVTPSEAVAMMPEYPE